MKNIAELRRKRRLEASQGSSIGAQVPHQVPSNKSPPIWREGAPQSCCLRTTTSPTHHNARHPAQSGEQSRTSGQGIGRGNLGARDVTARPDQMSGGGCHKPAITVGEVWRSNKQASPHIDRVAQNNLPSSTAWSEACHEAKSIVTSSSIGGDSYEIKHCKNCECCPVSQLIVR